MKSLLPFFGALLLLLAFVPGCSPSPVPGEEEASVSLQDAGEPEAEIQEDSSLTATGMAILSGRDVALRLFDQEYTYSEILDYFQRLQNAAVRNKNRSSQGDLPFEENTRQQKQCLQLLRGIIQQKVLLQEAREKCEPPTEADRHRLSLRWTETNPGKTLDDYLARFSESPVSSLQISRTDALLLLKYLDSHLADVQVPPEMVEDGKKRLQDLRNFFQQEMAKRLEEFKAIAKMDGFQTDEGFCLLAKNFSEGAESVQGGVFSTPMTRQEITDCNWGQPFTLVKGQSSGLIETPTSYRYIRVLEEYPPQQAGGEETLKVAQILLAKREPEGIPTEEELVKKMQKSFQEKWTLQHIAPILRSDAFDCPLFPLILEDWLPAGD
ncbi:MAG: hypothetical protein ACI4SG_04320 [Oligosphaeraceae bacterium]